MPTFKFKWSDQPDDVFAVQLNDNEEAWSEATRYVGEALRDIDGRFPVATGLTLTVIAEDGGHVATISVSAQRGT